MQRHLILFRCFGDSPTNPPRRRRREQFRQIEIRALEELEHPELHDGGATFRVRCELAGFPRQVRCSPIPDIIAVAASGPTRGLRENGRLLSLI